MGLFLPHPMFHASQGDLYRADAVHLSDKGMDINLMDVQQELMEALGSKKRLGLFGGMFCLVRR